MRKLRIIYYPVMHRQSDIADALGRACWYFYPWASAISEVLIGSTEPVSVGELELPDLFDESVEHRRSALLPQIAVQRLSDADILAAIGSDEDVLLLNWDTSALPPEDVVSRLKAKGRYYQVDPRTTRNEGSFYLWAGRNAFGATDAAIAECEQALDRLANAVRGENVYIFGTGPSLSRLSSFGFPDGQAIVINSMVRNTELLDRLDVLAIAAGDPIFHAGCSRYAAAFREQLVSCLGRYRPFLLVPLRDYEMYKSFIPPAHHERIVGLPFDAKKPYNLDLRSSFHVSPKPNILTLVLFPVAATFFKNILVSGCDGRPRSENSYFWSHDKKSQFNDEMDNIKRVHPAFFEISYDQYYSDHEQTVSEVVEAIEAKGKRVESLTPSFIDAFGSRYRGIEQPRVVCIDPDGVSDHGHYLNYDDLLAGEAARRGVDFTLLGPLKPQPAVRESRWHFLPTFSIHSWQLRHGAKPPSARALAMFRAQLSSALGDAVWANDEIVLFMYCGSPESAEEIAEALEAFPRASACVNLFWLSLLDLSAGEYVEQWRDRIQRLSRSSQVTLTASSSELADDIERAFGVRLAVLPHPSTTFADSNSLVSGVPGPRPEGGKIRVLFPGSGTEGKGWEETLSALPALNDLLGDRCEFSLRVAAGSPTDPASREMFNQIRGRVRVIEGVLSRAEFRQMIDDSDIVVLPYDSRAFRNRTSGLLVDALRLRKPVIAIKGSWLGNRIEEYRCGIAVGSAAADELQLAIDAIAANYENCANAAGAAFERFSERNSWKALLDTILSAADGAALRRTSGPSRRFARSGDAWPEAELVSVPQPRSRVMQFDECKCVFALLERRDQPGTMIDVGAHTGTALGHFAAAGWRVFAFEPDPANRERLVRNVGQRPNVIISEEAVSDVAGQDTPFYASSESTGISSLGAFRDSHREVARVRTVTLAEIATRHQLRHVDFLKIDVEGYEMPVLRGLDFNSLKPSVIVAEFDGRKTKGMGYILRDLARLLVDQGYAVYVSEWHPIERYGVKHSWRGIRKYPCDVPADSWGNLIAFQTPPAAEQLEQAVRAGLAGGVLQVERGLMSGLAEDLWRRPAILWGAILLVAAVALAVLPSSWVGPAPGALFAVLVANLLISAWAIRRKSKSLKKRSKRQRRALRRQIRDLQERLSLQVQDLKEQLRRRVEAQERTAELVDAQDKAFSRLNSANATRARVHARLLEESARERLERHWAPLFGQQFRPSALSYLAHQICLAEDRCEGRLATTIETAMLRLVALRSLKGPQVEVLEIGSLFGLGAGLLHRHRGAGIARLRLTLIDPLNGYYGAGEPDPVTGVMVGPETLMGNLRNLEVPAEDVRVLRGLSTDPEIIAAAREGAYDLLLIDGDHSGAGVRRDFELYGPMVRPGGLVLFDDYDTRDWPEIKPAVDTLIAAADGWEWLGADWRIGIARRTTNQA
jgi:FkbM family methyltransferase